jgi:hypothetical protein
MEALGCQDELAPLEFKNFSVALANFEEKLRISDYPLAEKSLAAARSQFFLMLLADSSPESRLYFLKVKSLSYQSLGKLERTKNRHEQELGTFAIRSRRSYAKWWLRPIQYWNLSRRAQLHARILSNGTSESEQLERFKIQLLEIWQLASQLSQHGQ